MEGLLPEVVSKLDLRVGDPEYVPATALGLVGGDDLDETQLGVGVSSPGPGRPPTAGEVSRPGVQ